MVVARVVALPWALLMVIGHRQPPYPPGVETASLLVVGLLALGTAAIVVLMRRSRRWQTVVVISVAGLALDIGTVGALVWLHSFDHTAALWALLFIPPLEGALLFALPGAIASWAATVVLYSARDLWGSATYGYAFSWHSVSFRMGIGLTIALVAGLMARNLVRQQRQLQQAYVRERTAREESERRANLLAGLGAASRRLSTLDPDGVLASVVDTAVAVGFEAAEICVLDDDRRTYTVPHARGLPRSYTGHTQSAARGLVGRTLAERRTVMVDDYGALPDAHDELRGHSFRATIAAPVWSKGDVVGVVVAGHRSQHTVRRDDVEAFELLAAQAGQALENARAFAHERLTVERLADLDRLKDDFLSTASHELRTPLTIINGLSATLERHWSTLVETGQARDLLGRIRANADALSEIVNNLLDLSRLQRESLRFHPTTFDLSGLLDHLGERLSDLLVEHPLVVQVEDGLTAEGDADLVERVIENLLVNAGKHTPPATHVTLSAAATADGVVVAVTDDGPGIDAADMDRITDRFYRGRAASTQSRGLGLGLSLVTQVLELHGSTLRIENRAPHGSRFSFTLPSPLATRGPLANASRSAQAGEVAGRG